MERANPEIGHLGARRCQKQSSIVGKKKRKGMSEQDKENYQLINSGWRMGWGERNRRAAEIDKEGGNNHIREKKRTRA